MHTNLYKALGFGLVAAVATLSVAPAAWSDDDRRDRRREHRHDHRERWKERRGHLAEVRKHEEERRKHAEERRKHEWERRREAEHRHREWRRAAERREWERRRDLDRHRALAHWRFERDRGWRFEHRPGAWSPFFVWWRIDGLPILRPYPTARIVRYPTGYYELIGDGITTPFYWVWRPTVVVTTPPPVPLPPPPPADYPFPTGGVYPPPPPVPTG